MNLRLEESGSLQDWVQKPNDVVVRQSIRCFAVIPTVYNDLIAYYPAHRVHAFWAWTNYFQLSPGISVKCPNVVAEFFVRRARVETSHHHDFIVELAAGGPRPWRRKDSVDPANSKSVCHRKHLHQRHFRDS